jgi:hypothetical protein
MWIESPSATDERGSEGSGDGFLYASWHFHENSSVIEGSMADHQMAETD